MSPQTQMRGNHRNGGPTQQPPPATVVVSSTSSMRPPPPPPPPRARASNEGKGHHEEPTSSIPDLGNLGISDADGKIMAPMRDTFYILARNLSFPFPH
ncbi:formin-J-like [Bombus pyrosoma]|uniref:formin-J-like n=1 Tax=Bombus pyrosoma TaxID=396416 RepID=UPI001CB8B249|nr:formin-J-like [Bombus pyrosoma]